MGGLMELATAQRYADRWTEPTFVVCIFNNRDLNMVTWEQRVLAGDPEYPASQTLPDLPYAQIAELIGLKGIRVDDPALLAVALEDAFTCGLPVVVEAVVDPDIPPMPPHVSFEQGANLVQALLRGDPDRSGVLRKTLRAKVGDLITRS